MLHGHEPALHMKESDTTFPFVTLIPTKLASLRISKQKENFELTNVHYRGSTLKTEEGVEDELLLIISRESSLNDLILWVNVEYLLAAVDWVKRNKSSLYSFQLKIQNSLQTNKDLSHFLYPAGLNPSP